MFDINLSASTITITSLKVFQYNIFLTCNYFYQRRFNFHLLADTIVPSNIKSQGQLFQAIVKFYKTKHFQ